MILDKKHEMQRKLFRQFAETEFTKEIQDELDETGEFNWDMHKKMARFGFMGVKIPKEYGGAGADSLTYALMVEELARVDAVLSIYANTSNSLGGGPLLLGGSEAQKQKYLPPVARGEKIMVFGLTEPGAGSDAGGTTTTAIPDGDDFIINGRKCFISGAPMADWAVVFAKTDLTAKGSKGISMFVVDMKLPGVSLGAHEKKMGINGYPTCDLVLEDVRVSKDCLVGPLHKGFQIAMKTLDGGRLGIAAQSVGIAQSALDEAVKYAKERKQFGRRIADFQGISFMLADMAADVEAARQLVYHAAVLKDAGSPEASSACSIAKYFAAEAANRCAYKAVQIHGGYGYIREYKVERIYRDARITTIYEGTSQVQQMVIAVTGKTTDKRGRSLKEISAFIVEKTDPGFTQGKHEKKMGIRGSSTCDLIFEDCVIPKDRMLGKKGEGFKIAMKTLDGGRIGIASQALGLGEGAVEEAIKYTKERVQFGKRISQFQNTQFQLAEMHTRMQAAQFLVYSAAMKKQNHEPYSMDAAMAKLFAAEAASDVTRRAVQLFGGYGYTREYPVERMMRDAKITEIYEGTSEVQRMVIASNLGVK